MKIEFEDGVNRTNLRTVRRQTYFLGEWRCRTLLIVLDLVSWNSYGELGQLWYGPSLKTNLFGILSQEPRGFKNRLNVFPKFILGTTFSHQQMPFFLAGTEIRERTGFKCRSVSLFASLPWCRQCSITKRPLDTSPSIFYPGTLLRRATIRRAIATMRIGGMELPYRPNDACKVGTRWTPVAYRFCWYQSTTLGKVSTCFWFQLKFLLF